MTKPIRAHALDKTDADVRARHEDIEKILDKMGERRVQAALLNGGIPTEWHNIAYAWLEGDKLEKGDG